MRAERRSMSVKIDERSSHAELGRFRNSDCDWSEAVPTKTIFVSVYSFFYQFFL